MVLVLDNSYAMAIAFDGPAAKVVPRLIIRIAEEGVVVPALWYWEFANGLAMALRYNRASRSDIEKQFADFSALPFSVDPLAQELAWTHAVAIAGLHKLTVYNAAYLELAFRHSIPLAMLDKALARAARAEGVEVIGG